MPLAYAELYCLSNYTFLQGASHPEELVERACELGYRALAITDECSLAGVVRAHVAAQAHGVKLLIGAHFRLQDGVRLILLACDRPGYGALARLITRGRRRAEKGHYRLHRSDLEEGLEGSLAILLPGLEPDPEAASWLATTFPQRAWIGLEQERSGADRERLRIADDLATQAGLPQVACGGVRMHHARRRPLLDTLTAIRLGLQVAEAGFELQPNNERRLRPLDQLARLFPPAALAATTQIAERCHFSLDELRYEYPEELVPEGITPAAHLRHLTEQGARHRWPQGTSPSVQRLLTHELTLIAELHYEPYFLTVHDIVRFARSRGILCQGRGSAANSAVCYCLGITEIDPARMEMLFERFISRERGEPPDIDVDFEHHRREEVIQYIYRKYGRDRAALAAAVISYRPKSALRDVGKALGLDADQRDRLAGSSRAWDGEGIAPERLRELGFDPESRILQMLMVLTRQLIGFPRHLSQHVGGFVISRGPLSELVPIENAAMPNRTVIQWDKRDLEALGLLKVDCLALGMLSAIHKAFDLLNHYHGWGAGSLPQAAAATPCQGASRLSRGAPPLDPVVARITPLPHPATPAGARSGSAPQAAPPPSTPLTTPIAIRQRTASQPPPDPFGAAQPIGLHNIPPEDPETYAMIQRGETIGVFQIESRAQMAMLPRLRPETFYDLVIEVALVRPGPIQGDMVHPYLLRRQGKEPVEYPSEAMRDVLGRTLGVPIFQEQVIKVAMVAAGFSPGEADQLRRSIATWRTRGTLERFEQRLIDGMRERGYQEHFARRIYRQILGFGEYGFPESHAASFALLVYVSAWLKRHHPAAFFAAILNSLPMGFYGPAQLVGEARRQGVEVRPVDVRHSDWGCTLESPARRTPTAQPAIRLGLLRVRGLSREAGEQLVAARRTQPFRSLSDLQRRCPLQRRDREALAAADAFSTLAGNRHQAAWEVSGFEPPLPLLPDPLPEATPLLRPPSEGESLLADYASTGLTLGRHPMALIRDQLLRKGVIDAAEVARRNHDDRLFTAGLVINRQRPGSRHQVTFVTLEDEVGHINLVVWKGVAERYRAALLTARLLAVAGKVQREGEVIHIIARRLVDFSELLGGLTLRSRDFH